MAISSTNESGATVAARAGRPGRGEPIRVEVEGRLLNAVADWLYPNGSVDYVLIDYEGRPIEDSAGFAEHMCGRESSVLFTREGRRWFCGGCGVFVGTLPVMCGPCVERTVDRNERLAQLLECF